MDARQSPTFAATDEPTRLYKDSRQGSFAQQIRRETQRLTPHLQSGDIWAEKYRILRLLGQGGMGDVYEAAHILAPELRFAVKIFRPSSHEELARQMLREASSIARVRHRNVVSVTDVGIAADGVPYLVMELVGVDLQEYTRLRGGVLPAKDAVEFCAQICDGLVAAHARGIVHRDIKPRNCLVHRELDNEYIVVSDFGLARSLDRDESPSREWTPAGSLGYMAPEILMGRRRPDQRVDIYSVGATLFCLLTGKPPLPEQQKASLSREAIAKAIPRALLPILLRTLTFDAERRYRSARELGAALRNSLPALSEVPTNARRAWLLIVLLWGAILGGLASLFLIHLPAAKLPLQMAPESPDEQAILKDSVRTVSYASVPLATVPRTAAEDLPAPSTMHKGRVRSKTKRATEPLEAPQVAQVVSPPGAVQQAQPEPTDVESQSDPDATGTEPYVPQACEQLRNNCQGGAQVGDVAIILTNRGNGLRLKDSPSNNQRLGDCVTEKLVRLCRDKNLSLPECRQEGEWRCAL